jgi:hypothetical protein
MDDLLLPGFKPINEYNRMNRAILLMHPQFAAVEHHRRSYNDSPDTTPPLSISCVLKYTQDRPYPMGSHSSRVIGFYPDPPVNIYTTPSYYFDEVYPEYYKIMREGRHPYFLFAQNHAFLLYRVESRSLTLEQIRLAITLFQES